MSFIIKIEIPTTNYYGDDVFMYEMYFECEKSSPTKEQVIKALEDIDRENKQYPEYLGEENEALDIVKLVEDDDWRFVRPLGIVGENTFVNHPKFGKQPFSWSVIKPIKLS